jgi:hypothetical protein
MRKINILFNENEWKAFLRRSSTSEESNINYEDMI